MTSGRGSRFLLCKWPDAPPGWPKYPPLPVLRCAGYAREPEPKPLP